MKLLFIGYIQCFIPIIRCYIKFSHWLYLYLCSVILIVTIMTKYKLKTGKVENVVVGAYKKIEDGVVDGYQAIEDALVGTYKKIEGKFVERFLEETDEEANSEK